MRPLVADVAWSGGLSLCLTRSFYYVPCKNGWTDRDAVLGYGVGWRTRMNRPCAAAMRSNYFDHLLGLLYVVCGTNETVTVWGNYEPKLVPYNAYESWSAVVCVDPWAAEFGRRRRILFVCRKSSEKNSARPTMAFPRRRRKKSRPISLIYL